MKSKIFFNVLIYLLGHTLLHGQWQYIKGDSYDPILPKYGIINQPHQYNRKWIARFGREDIVKDAKSFIFPIRIE